MCFKGRKLHAYFMFLSQCILYNAVFIRASKSLAEHPEWIEDMLRLDYDVKCKMQPNAYDCSSSHNLTSVPRYYYDVTMKTCRTFDYYECRLSLNNFLTLFECNEHCRVEGYRKIEEDKPTVFCRLQSDFGDCHSYYPKYYFDINSRTCKGFSYSGCGGNKNRFDNAQQCVAVCSGVVAMMT